MDFIIANLRLNELVAVVNANRPFFEDFVAYLMESGYADLYSFISEQDSAKALTVFRGYLQKPSEARLYDGLGRPYSDLKKARWYFLAWLFRDAPVQRLQPLLSSVPGSTIDDRRCYLLNELRIFVQPLFPSAESWTWAVISEVMLSRLEGSRRALKGTFFEAIVRSSLHELFKNENVTLGISDTQIKLHDETYDVRVTGSKGSILLPVKTRETMGGGHALLFTRDIHKSITVARSEGMECIPIVIAESWGGNLDSLLCQDFIYIKANPNQVTTITPVLAERLKNLLPRFKDLE